jgi:putative transposase
MPDHIHLFISVPPTVLPVTIVQRIKSISATKIFEFLSNLKQQYFWGSGLWSRRYYVGTAGTVTAETIRTYIERQKGV